MKSVAPGPIGWPILGCFPAFARNPLRFWLEITDRYGLVVQYPLGRERHFLISDPKWIAHVFRYDTDRYYRGPYHDLLKPAFGEGLLTTNDEVWRKQRHWVKPPFKRHAVADWQAIIVSTTQAHLEHWRQHGSLPFDLAPAFAALVQEINAKILFGHDMDYHAHPQLLAAVNTINDSLLRQVKRATILGNFSSKLPLPDVWRFRRAISLLHQTIDRLIADPLSTATGPQALYTYLRQSVCPADLDETRALRDQLITLFLAGHETTAVALGWIAYYVSEYPQWQERLHEELTAQPGIDSLTDAHVDQVPLMKSVIQEALRLNPPVYAIGRRARRDDVLGDYQIPANSPVIISPYVVHRHPDFWENPDQFNPERFMRSLHQEPTAFTYFPFGGGPHLCIGRHLALLELRTITTLVLQAFRLITPPGRTVELQPWITLRPKLGIAVQLQAR